MWVLPKYTQEMLKTTALIRDKNQLLLLVHLLEKYEICTLKTILQVNFYKLLNLNKILYK